LSVAAAVAAPEADAVHTAARVHIRLNTVSGVAVRRRLPARHL